MLMQVRATLQHALFGNSDLLSQSPRMDKYRGAMDGKERPSGITLRFGALAESASEQLRRAVRLSPAEINAEAASHKGSHNGARSGNAQIS